MKVPRLNGTAIELVLPSVSIVGMFMQRHFVEKAVELRYRLSKEKDELRIMYGLEGRHYPAPYSYFRVSIITDSLVQSFNAPYYLRLTSQLIYGPLQSQADMRVLT